MSEIITTQAFFDPETWTVACVVSQSCTPHWQTSVGEQRASNIHVHDGVTEEVLVAMRTARDATLGMPALIVPAIQVNVRAFCVQCAHVISSTLGRLRLMGNFLVALQFGLFFALAALATPNAIEQGEAAGMAYLASEGALA